MKDLHDVHPHSVDVVIRARDNLTERNPTIEWYDDPVFDYETRFEPLHQAVAEMVEDAKIANEYLPTKEEYAKVIHKLRELVAERKGVQRQILNVLVLPNQFFVISATSILTILHSSTSLLPTDFQAPTAITTNAEVNAVREALKMIHAGLEKDIDSMEKRLSAVCRMCKTPSEDVPHTDAVISDDEFAAIVNKVSEFKKRLDAADAARVVATAAPNPPKPVKLTLNAALEQGLVKPMPDNMYHELCQNWLWWDQTQAFDDEIPGPGLVTGRHYRDFVKMADYYRQGAALFDRLAKRFPEPSPENLSQELTEYELWN